MKILFITPCIPSQSDGRRPFNFIRYLVERHEVHLAAFRLPAQSPELLRPLRDWEVKASAVEMAKPRSLLNCAFGLLNGQPLRTSWCCSTSMRRTIEAMLDQHDYDVVHIDRMRMGQYAPFIDRPKLLDFTDSLTLYLQRSLTYRQSMRDWFVDRWELHTIPNHERWLLKYVDAALVCSEIDARVFRDYHPNHTFDVICNACDAQQFKPRSRGGRAPSRVVLTGTLFYFPNVDSLIYYQEDILPLLRQADPSLKTEVIGTRPNRVVRALDGFNGIKLHIDVPRMQDFLYENDIYLCPVRVAAGVRNKLLEAMASGMAIITTEIGAEGLEVQDGKEVLFADEPHEFLQAYQKIQSSPHLRKTLGYNARQYVIAHHNLDNLGQQLEAVYSRIAENLVGEESKRVNVI